MTEAAERHKGEYVQLERHSASLLGVCAKPDGVILATNVTEATKAELSSLVLLSSREAKALAGALWRQAEIAEKTGG